MGIDAGRGAVKTTIAPWLSVRGSKKAVEFYKTAFGAAEAFKIEDPDGNVVARLSVEGAEFWVGDESPEHKNFSPETLGGGTVRMVLTVGDPDASFARAVKAGATVVHAVEEEQDGEWAGWWIRLGIIGRLGGRCEAGKTVHE